MAVKKPKMKAYPKKPKKNATLTQKRNYLNKKKEVDKENARRKREYENAKKQENQLNKKIWG